MRNVNQETEEERKENKQSFILTMRNVNVIETDIVLEPKPVLY